MGERHGLCGVNVLLLTDQPQLTKPLNDQIRMIFKACMPNLTIDSFHLANKMISSGNEAYPIRDK